MEPFYIYGCHYGSVYSFQKVRRKVYLSQSKLEWLTSSRGSLSPLFLMWKSLSIHFLPKQGRKFWTSRFNRFPFLFCTLGCSALFPDDFFPEAGNKLPVLCSPASSTPFLPTSKEEDGICTILTWPAVAYSNMGIMPERQKTI